MMIKGNIMMIYYIVNDLLKEPLSTKGLIFLKEKIVNVNHVFDKTVQFHITIYKNN